MDHAVCRIYLFTYKRNALLKRAIESLVSQSFTNWVCELHNDCPEDFFPRDYLITLNDPRFILVNHNRNLGATASFNLAFMGCEEAYAAMLEDDNWWEPDFLKVMLKKINDYDFVEVAVANENVWDEKHDGTWINTEKTIWPTLKNDELFTFKLEDKCGSAKICNSSMLWKTLNSKKWITPNNIPIDVTEHFRERLLPHPILLVHDPLANFSRTMHTYRSNSTAWSIYQALLIASVLHTLKPLEANEAINGLWEKAAHSAPFKTTLFNASVVQKTNLFFKKAGVYDLFKYSLTCLKNPLTFYKIVTSKNDHRQQWEFLTQNLVEKNRKQTEITLRKKICIVSQTSVSRNPRVLKEAIALSGELYSVDIITAVYSKKLIEEDTELLKGYPISYILYSDLSKRTVISFADRLIRLIATKANKWFRVESKLSLGYAPWRLKKICVKSNADLYIMHQELATAVGGDLMKRCCKVAFDLEDWYSEDLLEEARAKRPVKLLAKSESLALKSGVYCSTTSYAMANELRKTYDCELPEVIYNVFNTELNLMSKGNLFEKPLKLFWFSQTIGPGRGLEAFIAASASLSSPFELHLLGDITVSYNAFLITSMPAQHKIFFHPLVSASALADKISEFDIGLAIELNSPPSRNYTITNKFFQYLQSGLPVIASETAGQVEIFTTFKPGFLLPRIPSAENIKALDYWLKDTSGLIIAREKAINAASKCNWEQEQKKLLTLVDGAINNGCNITN